MTEQELERERCIDDDYEVVNNYYRAKYWHPNIPFYLQDENGDTYEFGAEKFLLNSGESIMASGTNGSLLTATITYTEIS